MLSERVAQCDVFLAVIGDAWLSMASPDGTRRLDDSTDFVCIEIEAALARGIPVIPVLVGRSSVPRANELPESLQKPAYRQAISLRPDPDFHHDMERLVGRIKSAVSAPRVATPEPVASPPPVPGRRRPPWKAIVAAAVLGLVLLGVIVYVATDRGQITIVRAPEVAPKEIVNSIGMRLVLISAGEFTMGSPDSDPDAVASQMPQHRVRIARPFYLGATEVTQRQYQAVTGANPSHFKGSEDLPVEAVSWLDAIDYCNASSRKEGLTPFYRVQGGTVEVPDWNGTGYRLPTDAEWEYACRAGSTTRYSFGDDAAGLGAFAWYSGNSRTLNVRLSQPVGQKRPNAWGLYDMHGNVEEWCWDGYEADYYSKKPPAADPLGPSQAASRVNRGGCWRLSPQRCRSAFRVGHAAGNRSALLRFRVARVEFGP